MPVSNSSICEKCSARYHFATVPGVQLLSRDGLQILKVLIVICKYSMVILISITGGILWQNGM